LTWLSEVVMNHLYERLLRGAVAGFKHSVCPYVSGPKWVMFLIHHFQTPLHVIDS
jgi:hypothetical protein